MGNFGNGQINAYNLTTGAFDGTLKADGASTPIKIPGLWDLQFGGGGGSPTTLYFTDGLNRESDGIFGSISAAAQPNATATVAAAITPTMCADLGGGEHTLLGGRRHVHDPRFRSARRVVLPGHDQLGRWHDIGRHCRHG